MKPYIFLSGNYLANMKNMNNESVDARIISEYVPYVVELNFTDMYGNPISRTIDTLILQDTNIANMTVEAMGAGGTYSTLFTVANNTDSTIIVKAATPSYAQAVRITIPETGNPETVTAKIGICGFICNLLALTDSNYKIAANQGDYRVVSGAYIHWADYKKWVGNIKMENLQKAQFDTLTAQADTGEMTVVPYTDLEANEIYFCGVNREYSWELNRKTELFTLELECNEL